jgi:hypothetical protein
VNHVCCEQKANCHTYNKCKYVARKEHNEPPIFYLVESAKPMPVCSGRWAAWRAGKENPQQQAHLAAGGVKRWQGLRNPAEGHRDQNNMTGVVSINLKKTPF